jgi:signal peptidase I
MINDQKRNQEDVLFEKNSFIIMDPKKLKKILLDNNINSEMIENDPDGFPRIDDSCMLVDPVRLSILLDPYKVDSPRTEEIINSCRSEGNLAKIPKDYYIMIGDNRTNSADARYFGLVNRRQIVGRAMAIVISCEGSIFKGHFRWHRFFKKLI